MQAHFLKRHAQEWYNSARRTLECTKSSMGFVAWSAFRYYGDRLFGDYIDNRYDTAREFASIIESDPEFNLLTHPESNIICFRHIPEALKDERLNQHNSNLRKRVISNGSFYIVQAEINGDTWLRITIINPMTGIEKLKALLDEIKNLAGSPI
ncbi:MAG: pyridoxal-dependent decarboxylase [Bacteroidales bacterium]